MRYLHRFLVLLPALVLVSCGGEGEPDEVPQAGELGREYVIGYGETIHVDSLALEFTTLDGDSRCPANAVCIWEGNARILLALTRGQSSTVAELNTSNRFPTVAVFEGYFVELRRLDPYPATAGIPQPQNYTATVFVDGHVSASGN